MIAYKQYVCLDGTKASVLEQVIKDIQDTSECSVKYTQRLKEQERVFRMAHETLRCFYEDSLSIFVGVRFIHWFSFENKSLHFKRDELLHLSDKEIAELMVQALINKDWWLECDVKALEENMPHKIQSAYCLECGKRWSMIQSIISNQREVKCVCGNHTSIIVS